MSTWQSHGVLRYLVKYYFESISRLSKADWPPQCGWAPSGQLKAWVEQNGTVKENSFWLAAFKLEYCFVLFFNLPFISLSPASFQTGTIPSALLVSNLLTTLLRTCQTLNHDSIPYNKFIYTFICKDMYIGFFSGELWLVGYYFFDHSPIIGHLYCFQYAIFKNAKPIWLEWAYFLRRDSPEQNS